MTKPADHQRLFADVDAIMAEANQRLATESVGNYEAGVAKMSEAYDLTTRQAQIAVNMVNGHIAELAKRRATTAEDIVEGLDKATGSSITGFAAGFITGYDAAKNVDPETGLPK